jgi:diguanylate cyclase (GGDEF)-like protein
VPTNNKPQVLIVDSSPSNLSRLGNILDDDYHITLASNWQQTLDCVQKTHPDIILLNIVMPEIDGYEMCRRLKADEKTKDIPLIFTTTSASEENEEKALLLGALDFLIDPFHPPILKAKVHNFSTLYRQQRLLEKLASIDGMTEIPNRRNYDITLDREWRRCLRARTPLSLIMVDIDCFKQYNDTYGHGAGDGALKVLADIMRVTISRPGDFIARYGGDEFTLVLPETDEKGGKSVAEAVRMGLEGMGIPHKNSPVSDVLTVTIGGATMIPNSTLSAKALACKADTMLYQAKRESRNLVAWDSEFKSEPKVDAQSLLQID